MKPPFPKFVYTEMENPYHYLVKGKRYRVIQPDTFGFRAVLVDGSPDYFNCWWTGCAHLKGGDWELVYVEEDTPDDK